MLGSWSRNVKKSI